MKNEKLTIKDLEGMYLYHDEKLTEIRNEIERMGYDIRLMQSEVRRMHSIFGKEDTNV